jgi:hypothetical protein
MTLASKPNEPRSPTVLEMERLLAEMSCIHALRADEGDSVTILCDNPEGPPNNAVECCGFWTEWNDLRFGGETLLAALQAAVADRVALTSAKGA